MSPVDGPFAPDAWVQNANAGRIGRTTRGTIDAPVRISSGHLQAIHTRLSPRDHSMLFLARRLRLVSGQIFQRFAATGEWGPSQDRDLRRHLERLTEWRVLDRLPRTVGGAAGGSGGWVYCVGPAGRRILTREGIDARRTRAPGARFVDHTLAVGTLVADLTVADRAGLLELTHWDAEPDCWRDYVSGFGGVKTLRPDLFVSVYASDGCEDWYYVEIDRATESLPTVLAKCRRYLDCMRRGEHSSDTNPFPLVLWVAPTDQRAERMREAIGTLRAADRHIFAVTTSDEAVELIARKAQQ